MAEAGLALTDKAAVVRYAKSHVPHRNELHASLLSRPEGSFAVASWRELLQRLWLMLSSRKTVEGMEQYGAWNNKEQVQCSFVAWGWVAINGEEPPWSPLDPS